MKTRNDILAEYVRKKYPEIERTLDFSVYSISESLKGLGGSSERSNVKSSDCGNFRLLWRTTRIGLIFYQKRHL